MFISVSDWKKNSSQSKIGTVAMTAAGWGAQLSSGSFFLVFSPFVDFSYTLSTDSWDFLLLNFFLLPLFFLQIESVPAFCAKWALRPGCCLFKQLISRVWVEVFLPFLRFATQGPGDISSDTGRTSLNSGCTILNSKHFVLSLSSTWERGLMKYLEDFFYSFVFLLL